MQNIMEDEDGNLWVADGRGGYAPYVAPSGPNGPQAFTIGTPRAPDPTLPYKGPAAAADLEGAQLSNEQKRAQIMEARYGKLPQGYRWKDDMSGAELIPGVPPPKSDGDDQKSAQRLANLKSLRESIPRVRELYEKTLRGGMPNQFTAVVPDFINPALGQFDSAGAGLAETGLAAFKVPGSGTQTDADMAVFIRANQPKSTDSDLQIEEKLRNLETRLNATLQEMGELPQSGAAGPARLPRAAGVKDAAPMQTSGVTGRGGIVPIPELRGIENTVIDMIGKGATTGQVIDFLDEKLAPHGAHVETDLAGHLGNIVRKHKANPNQPVRSLGEGWEQLWHRRVPEDESSMFGRAADSDLGTAAAFAANAATFGLPATMAGKSEVMDAAAQERPLAALGGEIAGGIGAMTGIGAASKMLGGAVGGALTRSGGVGGDMLYGAVRGGVEDGPAGALTGGLAAGVGNKVGSGLASGTGRAIRGVSDPAVRYLSERGIPLTAGMTMGRNSAVGNFMNHLESLPGIRGIMADRYRDAEDGVFRTALNDSVEGIGGQIVDTGAEGLQQAYEASDNAYARALSGRQFQANEPQFLSDMQAAIAKGQAVPELGPQFEHAIRKDIKPLFDQQGMMTGERLQDALQFLRKRRSGYNAHPMGTDINDAFTGVEDAIRDMAGRQSPDVLPQLDAANTAYRHINVLADASANAVNRGGIPTPAQLNMASRNNAKKFQGKRAAVTGGRPFGQLGDAAQAVIPSAVNDSGTSGRLAAIMLPTAIAGGAGGADYMGASPALTAPLLALAALTSKTGSRVAQKALTAERPEAIADLGEFLIRNRRKTGIFGAATGGAMVPALSQ